MEPVGGFHALFMEFGVPSSGLWVAIDMELTALLHAVGNDPFELAALLIPGGALFAAGFAMIVLPVLRAQENAFLESPREDTDRPE